MTNIKFLITTTIGDPLYKLDPQIRVCSKNIIIQPFKNEESINFIKWSLSEEIKNEKELNDLIALLDIQSERPVKLTKQTDLIKLKLNATDLRNLLEELKLNKRLFEALDTQLFENLIVKEEKAWNILKQSSFLDSNFSPDSIYTELFEIDEKEFYDDLSKITN